MTDEFTVTDKAAEVIQRVSLHLQGLAHGIGDDHAWFGKAAGSWARSLGQAVLLVSGGGRLMQDMDTYPAGFGMSLYGVAPGGMNFGVIFHRDPRYDGVKAPADMNKRMVCAMHGFAPWNYVDSDTCPDRGESQSDCFPRTIPVPGEWSLHS